MACPFFKFVRTYWSIPKETVKFVEDLFRVSPSVVCHIYRMESENTYITVDWPDGSTILRYIRGNASEEERAELDVWLKEDPEREQILLQVARIYYANQTQERIAERDTLQAYQKVQKRIEKKPFILFWSQLKYKYSIVASIALFCGLIGAACFVMEREKTLSLSLLEIPEYQDCREVLLITKEEQVSLDGDDVFIEYDKSGKANIDQLAYKSKKDEIQKKPGMDDLTHVVVPKGKRANIVLSDSTIMYVNAGTSVVYPTVFSSDKREILVDGEVYLDVKKASSWPFIVKTEFFDIKVLGTQFNVCAYKEDTSAAVALVKGQVEVETGQKEKTILAPNQLLKAEKGEEMFITVEKDIDAFGYICWTQNIMLLKNNKIGEVFDRISRYYGCNIIYDKSIGDLLVSGKLDFQDSVEDVVEMVCQSVFLRYEIDDNNILILK